MKWKGVCIVIASIYPITAWLFLGIEEVHLEHRAEYRFFVKQSPTFQVIYRNPVVCGECDVEPYSAISTEQRAALSAFCRVRFGLDSPRVCYAMFEEEQRIAGDGYKASHRAP
jgi:hypothetical protein